MRDEGPAQNVRQGCGAGIGKAAFVAIVLLCQSGAAGKELIGVWTGSTDSEDSDVSLPDLEVEIYDNDTFTWSFLGNWAVFDDEDMYWYWFRPVTGSGTSRYRPEAGTLTLDGKWTGDIGSTSDSNYHCTEVGVRTEFGALTVSPDTRTISGRLYGSAKFFYPGYGSWSDGAPFGVELTNNAVSTPTWTPSRTRTPTRTQTSTPTETPEPTPTQTELPTPTPTEASPCQPFDVTEDGAVDQDDLFALVDYWYQQPSRKETEIGLVETVSCPSIGVPENASMNPEELLALIECWHRQLP